MPAYDRQTSLRIWNEYHVLKLMVRPAAGFSLVPSDDLHGKVVRELNNYISNIASPYFAIWTREFFDPRSPVIDYSTVAEPNAFAIGDSIPLNGGRCLASIVLPSAFVEAKPNPRGRPGSSSRTNVTSQQVTRACITGLYDPIELGVARAVMVQVYRLVRFIAGHLDAENREVANDRAMDALHPYVEPLSAMTFHRGSSGLGVDDGRSVVTKILTDMCEEAPAHVAFIYGTQDSREMGWAWAKAGKAQPRKLNAKPTDLPQVQDMLAVLQSLVALRLEARVKADAIRRLKREAVKQDKLSVSDTAGEGYDVPSDVAEAIGLMRYADRLPGDAMMVRLAHEFEFDASRLMPTKAYLRPLMEAAMAVGAYERRVETERSVLATYGLRAWSRGFYGLSHPACQAALEIASTIPNPLLPALDEMPEMLPVDAEMRRLKSTP
ncbi:hypothetical protein [Aureimonas pseudogalii]|uniref:Uncharacterized protein n=1 Tax=Aureimonas pseudogalii TaxID=1744844 RepID=A0A7W6H5P7_9HYPH|nr:hypothetical protein [Aureimonas pseudogalii]MBB3999047.1 hypothetical protein [Aureimonas pseudogalii]